MMFTEEEIAGILTRLGNTKETDFDGNDSPFTFLAAGGSARAYSQDFGKRKFAIKRFKNDPNSQLEMNHELRLYNEFAVDKHPNIIDYYGYNVPARSIVLEYAELGDLHSYMKKSLRNNQIKAQYLTVRLDILVGMALGLAYLHSKRILHRDIKLKNILLCQNGQVKLCDFSFSQKLEPGHDKFIGSFIGTIFFVSPEICNHKRSEYSFGSDLWALGVSYWMLYSFVDPYTHCKSDFYKDRYDITKCRDYIANGGKPDASLISDEGVRKLAVTLWSQKPEDRQSADYVVNEIRNEIEKKAAANTLT